MGDEKKLGFIITAKDLASKEFKSINGEIAKMEKTTKGAKTGFGGLMSTVSPMKVAMLGVGLGATVAAEGLSIAISAASDLREATSLSGQVFEKNQDQMLAWAKTAQGAFGQSQREALTYASQFGTTFKNVGIGLDETAKKSQELTHLAADLGSAFNASSDEVATALKSGLLGESEPMRRFGVFLSEAAVQAKAVQLGIVKMGQKLTDAQKVTARYAIIMEQTTDSQGMFGRDTDSLADAQKELQATTENLAATVGTVLVPAMAEAVGGTADLVSNIQTLAEAMDDAQLFGIDLTDWVGHAMNVFDLFTMTIRAPQIALEELTKLVGTSTDEMGADIDQFAGKAKDDLVNVATQGLRPVRKDAQKARDALHDMKEEAESALGPVLEAVYGPAILKGEEAGILGRIKDTKAELAELPKGASRARTELEGELAQERADLVRTREKMSALGMKPATDSITTWINSVDQRVVDLGRDAAAALRKFQVLGGYTGGGGGGSSSNGGSRAYASGGYFPPGTTGTVGEAGIERVTMFPGGGAWVEPNPGSSGGGGSSPVRSVAPVAGTAPLTIQFNSLWPPTREQAREIAQMVDRELHSIDQRAVPTIVRT